MIGFLVLLGIITMLFQCGPTNVEPVAVHV